MRKLKWTLVEEWWEMKWIVAVDCECLEGRIGSELDCLNSLAIGGFGDVLQFLG
jgi:hypothetical protein